MKKKFFQAFIMGLFFYSATVGALSKALPWDPPTDAEFAMMPAYCASRLKHLPDYNHWRQVLGPIFEDIHHYCAALNHFNRYYKSSTAADRQFHVQNAISNIDYVLGRINPTQPKDVVVPEIHFLKGKVLMLARDSKSAGEFLQAIQLKPGYVDPYVALADFYFKTGMKQDALKILEEGLRQVPTSRGLARRYKELGGKSPLPELPPQTVSAAAPAETKTTGVKADVNAPIEPAVSIPTPASASEGAATSVARQPAPAAEDSPKIGSPTNPYCRFCSE